MGQAVLRQVVIDVLKPHEPSMTDISKRIVQINGIDGVNTVVYDVDKDVESVKLTIEGSNIPLGKVVATIEGMGASVHGVDEVSYGKKLVKEVTTPRDRWMTSA